MGLLTFNQANLGDALAGLSQGLLAYGTGNPQGLLSAPLAIQQRKQDRLQNTRQQQLMDMEKLKFDQAQAEHQQQLTREAAARAALGIGGPTAPMQPNNGRPGGMPTPQANPSLSILSGLPPEYQAYARTLVQSDPIAALEFVGKALTAKPDTQHKIGDTRDYVSGNTRVTEQWDGLKFVLLGRGAAFAPPSQTNVNLPPEQDSGAKELGKLDAQTFSDIQKAGMNASVKIAKADRLGALLQQVGTGKYTGTMVELKKGLQSFGIDPTALGLSDNMAVADAAKPLIGELTLELRNPSGGAGMPGAMSDQDRQFLQSMVPNLETNPNAIPLIVDFNKRLAGRDQDIAKITREYRKKHGGNIDAGMYDDIQAYADSHPLFTQADIQAIQALGPSPAVTAPTGQRGAGGGGTVVPQLNPADGWQ